MHLKGSIVWPPAAVFMGHDKNEFFLKPKYPHIYGVYGVLMYKLLP